MKRIAEDLWFIEGISFQYASHMQVLFPISRKTVKVITSQPGYKGGKEMIIYKIKDGGYRLFVRVGDRWKDASLKDIE